MALANISDAEGAQADLHHGAIVENLERHVGVVDALLQVRHEYEIARLEPAIVQRIVIDVAEHGLGAQSVGRVVGVDELAELVDELLRALLVVGVVLVVDVLDLAQVDAAHLLLVAPFLDVLLELLDQRADLGLVLEPLDVLGAVRVALLQDLDELLAHAVGHGEHAAAYAILVRLVGDVLVVLADVGVELDVLVALQDVDELVEHAQRVAPVLGVHALLEARVVVEVDGDLIEQDLDVHGRTELGGLGDGAQLGDELDLLEAVGALAAARRADLVELVEHLLVRDLLVFGEQLGLLGLRRLHRVGVRLQHALLLLLLRLLLLAQLLVCLCVTLFDY